MTANNELSLGQAVDLVIDRMAHGGEGIATGPDGRVVFVAGAYPGDEITAEITEVKKRFARGRRMAIRTAGPYRVEQTCPAAEAGGGCCDFGDLDPAQEPGLKAEILLGQLSRVVDVDKLPELDVRPLAPHRGWRTRVRLGVGEDGRAGVRVAGSNEIVTDQVCTQAVEGMYDGIVGAGARTFTPGAEVIAVVDADGTRHVVETRRPGRGRRTETVSEVIEGTEQVRERVDGAEFRFPATAFWQAHTAAPAAYTGLVREWLADVDKHSEAVAWDLYGGVGLFVPALGDSLGDDARIVSVDYSPAAAASEQPGLVNYDVTHINKRVENAISKLPTPDVVVLDPPRTGAGKQVVEATAAAAPARVIHIGCDPATFARDIATWGANGYEISKLALLDAFPGTHHFEVIAELRAR